MRAASLFILLMSAPVSCWAADLQACFERWEPYAYQEHGKATGAAVALVDRIMREMGHKVHYQMVPYARCLAMAKRGEVDLMFFGSPAETPTFAYTETAFAFWRVAVVVRKDAAAQHFHALNDFRGKRIGMVTDYSYPGIDGLEGMYVDSSPDPESNIRKLAAGRVDLILEDEVWARNLARREKLKVVVLHPLLKNYPCGIGFSPQYTSLLADFERRARSISQSGAVDRIYFDFFGVTYRDLAREK